MHDQVALIEVLDRGQREAPAILGLLRLPHLPPAVDLRAGHHHEVRGGQLEAAGKLQRSHLHLPRLERRLPVHHRDILEPAAGQRIGGLLRLAGADQQVLAAALPVANALHQQVKLAAETVHGRCGEGGGLNRSVPRHVAPQHPDVENPPLPLEIRWHRQMRQRKLLERDAGGLRQAQVPAELDAAAVAVLHISEEALAMRLNPHRLVHDHEAVGREIVAKRGAAAVDVRQIVHECL